MRTVLVLIAAVLLAIAPAQAKQQVFVPEDDGQISFVMPSGNIGCIYTPRGGTPTYQPVDGGPEISCDRIAPSYVSITLGPAIRPVVPGDDRHGTRARTRDRRHWSRTWTDRVRL